MHLPARGAAPSDRARTRQASVLEVGDRRPAHRCGGTSMTGGRLLEMRGAADVSQRRRSQAVLHLSARGAAPSDCAGTWQASAPEVGDMRPAHSCGGTSVTGGRGLEIRGAAAASQRRRSQAVLHLPPCGAAPSDRAGARQASAPEVGDRRPAHRCGGASVMGGRGLEIRGATATSC